MTFDPTWLTASVLHTNATVASAILVAIWNLHLKQTLSKRCWWSCFLQRAERLGEKFSRLGGNSDAAAAAVHRRPRLQPAVFALHKLRQSQTHTHIHTHTESHQASVPLTVPPLVPAGAEISPLITTKQTSSLHLFFFFSLSPSSLPLPSLFT